MKSLGEQFVWCVLPTCLLWIFNQLALSQAYLRSVRIEEIPFSLADSADETLQKEGRLFGPSLKTEERGILAKSGLEQRRGFFHLFNIPYIVCFFAAKGKWPFIPTFMQGRVDATARTFFKQNDSAIKQFCQKWIQIKQCFRPLFATTSPSDVEQLDPLRSTPCTCANEPIVYFDRDHIGNVSRETILSTIEFLETFLVPPVSPTKKSKKKNRVRSRVDEIDIE
ncbi:uncharacterized protein LOC126754754 [Bactrocera neohumeralis]|uniref:uncharacterized protein LOC126754754 n=1 Tax=Bactrocera neohumeralis TaxID=98809 RepID=UPI0021652861|nr:uncharacterized protein LOC126754754 [Bactrocera neohumeralis]